MTNKQLVLESLRSVPHLAVDLDECLGSLADEADCECIVTDVLKELGSMGLSQSDRGCMATRMLKRMVAAWQAGQRFENDRIADCI